MIFMSLLAQKLAKFKRPPGDTTAHNTVVLQTCFSAECWAKISVLNVYGVEPLLGRIRISRAYSNKFACLPFFQGLL